MNKGPLFQKNIKITLKKTEKHTPIDKIQY